MSTDVRSITADELFHMNIEGRCELVKGELRTMAPAGFDHGAIIINLSVLLGQYVKTHKLGVVLGAETGFTLARKPDTVRGADVSFVAASRIPRRGRPIKFWEGAPDLAVEVMSPDDSRKEVNEKVQDYLTAGCRLVWVVDPKRRSVTIHRPRIKPVSLRESESLSGEDVVPGFECRVAEIFV